MEDEEPRPTRPPRPQKADRRARGSGGLSKPRAKDGYVRGYRGTGAGRKYTAWYPTKTLADHAIADIVMTGADVDDLPDEVVEAPAIHTVGEAIAGWMTHEAILASSTRGGYEQSARHYLANLLGEDVLLLKRETVNAHYQDMARNKNLSQSTIGQAHAVLKGGLSYAHDNGWASSNVAFGIKIPASPPQKVEALNPADRARLLAACSNHRYEARYRLALLWGLRPGEATGLTWAEVDFAHGTIEIAAQLQRSRVSVDGVPLGTIFRARAKSAAGGRTLWIDEGTMLILAAWKETQAAEAVGRVLTPFQVQQRAKQAARLVSAKQQGLLANAGLYSVAPADGLVFTLANGDPILPRWDADMWTALCKSAGLKHRRPYVARHTAFNHMLRSGAPLAAVSVAAGHHSQAFTERVYGGNRDVLGDGLAAFLGD